MSTRKFLQARRGLPQGIVAARGLVGALGAFFEQTKTHECSSLPPRQLMKWSPKNALGRFGSETTIVCVVVWFTSHQ